MMLVHAGLEKSLSIVAEHRKISLHFYLIRPGALIRISISQRLALFCVSNLYEIFERAQEVWGGLITIVHI